MSNYYPSIPDPQNNTESLADTARALKMAVETLAGQRDGGAATRVFEQADEPKGPRVGDTWVETQDAGRIRIWNGSFWVDISDSRFSVLEKSSANASAMIKQLSTVRVTDTEAFAQMITELEAKFNANSARIYEELTVRATAEEALAQRISNLTATISTNTYSVQAALSDEKIARANSDGAIASAVTTASVGATRVYVQDTPPSASGRLTGDVWYDSSNSYKPYYWNGSWLDNSSGAYKIGQVAAISQSLTSTQNKVDNTLGVQWAVQAVVDGATGGLKFTGLKKADGTGATYDFVIDANTTINGNLLVNGSITATQIALGAISSSDFGTGSNEAAITKSVTSGTTYLIIASYLGGARTSYAANANTDIGYQIGSTQYLIRGKTISALGDGIVTTVTGRDATGGITGFVTELNYVFYGTTAFTKWTATTTGTVTLWAHSYSGSTALTQGHTILVIELKR